MQRWQFTTNGLLPFTSKTRQHGGFSTIFLCVSLFVSFHFQAALLSQKPFGLFWVASFHFFYALNFFYSSPATKLLFISLWFSSSGLLLFFFLSSYLCVAFSFCFSFLLPANDNQHTDGKPVPVSLSSLPSFSFQFPVPSHSLIPNHPSSVHHSSHVQPLVLAVNTSTVGFCVHVVTRILLESCSCIQVLM